MRLFGKKKDKHYFIKIITTDGNVFIYGAEKKWGYKEALERLKKIKMSRKEWIEMEDGIISRKNLFSVFVKEW